MLPTILCENECSMVIDDKKGNLYNKSAEELKKRGYKVYKIDFINFNGDFKYKQKDYSDYNTPFVQLCSYRGMDMNVLSISPKKILVNEDAIAVQDILYKNGFDVIPVRLRHCELFGGGIHCSTLDLVRQD